MAMVGIKVAFWEGLSAGTRAQVRTVSARVGLGDPVTLSVAGTPYYCFDDDRLGITTAQIVARFPASSGHVRGVDEDWTEATP